MKLNRCWAIMIIAACAFSTFTPLAQAMKSGSTSAAVEGWFKKKKEKEVKDSVSTKNDYEKLTDEKSLVSRGVFNVFQDGGNYYFEVPRPYVSPRSR